MIADASKNTVRLYYTSVRYEDGMFLFRLDPDSVPDETFSQDTLFIFEQRGRFKKKPILAEVGTFWEYREDGAVMAIKAAPRKPRLQTMVLSVWITAKRSSSTAARRQHWRNSADLKPLTAEI